MKLKFNGEVLGKLCYRCWYDEPFCIYPFMPNVFCRRSIWQPHTEWHWTQRISLSTTRYFNRSQPVETKRQFYLLDCRLFIYFEHYNFTAHK